MACTKLFVVCGLFFFVSLHYISGQPGGSVLVMLNSLKNPGNKDYQGLCCDGKKDVWAVFLCKSCDLQLSIWVTCDGKTSDTDCLYGKGKTGVFYKTRGISFHQDLGNKLRNPLVYNFASFQGNLGISILATRPAGSKIYDYKFHQAVYPKTYAKRTWINATAATIVSSKSRIELSYQVYCKEHYYTPSCTVGCFPGANYICDEKTGKKLCQGAWTGPNCTCKTDSPKYNCDSSTGKRICFRPWFGEKCDVRCHGRNDKQSGYICDSTSDLSSTLTVQPITLSSLEITSVYPKTTPLITTMKTHKTWSKPSQSLADIVNNTTLGHRTMSTTPGQGWLTASTSTLGSCASRSCGQVNTTLSSDEQGGDSEKLVKRWWLWLCVVAVVLFILAVVVMVTRRYQKRPSKLIEVTTTSKNKKDPNQEPDDDYESIECRKPGPEYLNENVYDDVIGASDERNSTKAKPENSAGQETSNYMSLKNNREPENLYQTLQTSDRAGHHAKRVDNREGTGQETSDYMSLKDNREPENLYQPLQTSSADRAKKAGHRDRTMQYENMAFNAYSYDN